MTKDVKQKRKRNTKIQMKIIFEVQEERETVIHKHLAKFYPVVKVDSAVIA